MENLLLQWEILWPALLAGLLVLATHVPLGQAVLRRGIIFLDLAIAQIAAFGLVLATTLGIGDHAAHSAWWQQGIAVTAAVSGAMVLYQLRRLSARVQEALIGILFILAATGSILLLAQDPHGGERLQAMLVGQILWVQVQDLFGIALLYAVVLGIWFGLRNRLGDWVFYPLFALTITFSTQLVGVYLVFASLIIPALATRGQYYALRSAYLLGGCGYLCGLVLSALLDLPAGAAIAWCLAGVALIWFICCPGKLLVEGAVRD
jgi:zinc/manganese transport system permease protein